MLGRHITEPGDLERPARGRGFERALLVIGLVACVQVGALLVGIFRAGPAPLAEVRTEAPAPVIAPAPAMAPAPLAAVDPVAPAGTEPAVPVDPAGVPDLAGPEPLDPGNPANVPIPEPDLPAAALSIPGAEALAAPAPLTLPPNLVNLPANLGGASGATDPDPSETASTEVSEAAVGAGAPIEPGTAEGAMKPVSAERLEQALRDAAPRLPLEEGIMESLLVTGAEHRGNGNNQGALKNFREVDLALPNHPRVLSEIALTLGRMGLEEKSRAQWERVEALGEVGAGPYFPIAGLALHGEPELPEPVPPVAGTAETPGSGALFAPGQLLRIAEVLVEEEAPTDEGQRVVLTITIDAEPASQIVADDIFMAVPFYDRLPGGEVKASTAETAYEHPSAPYLWDQGSETIVVKYLQPVFSEEQRREVGERSFYGYAIELYYRGELQHKVAMPEDIAALRLDAVPREPLRRPSSGPENALFPTLTP